MGFAPIRSPKSSLSFGKIEARQDKGARLIHIKEAHTMNANFEEIRDPQTHRLLGIYCQEEGIFESKQKGRVMRIRFPPGTPIEFIFTDSETAA